MKAASDCGEAPGNMVFQGLLPFGEVEGKQTEVPCHQETPSGGIIRRWGLHLKRSNMALWSLRAC